MTKEQLGFIGLGSMGKPMVQNLVRAGYAVAVHDANAQAAAQMSDEHIRV
ncbi:MAG: NAD(P)-binding domain-containing protein, partial [Advenella sp.]